MDETMIFKCDDLENYMITETLMKVNKYLEEKGYNGINQIVGYLSTGDSSYISSYKDARNKIQEIDRAKIVEILLTEFQKQK